MAWAETLGVAQNPAASPPRSRAVAITIEWAFFALLVSGLAWVPFWYGSHALIAWGINAIIFPSLAALYELSLILRGVPRPVAIPRIRLAAALFAAAAVWALVQNATWVPAGWHHPIWQIASDLLGRPVAGSISVDRSLTAVALVRLITAASVFWLALQLSRDVIRARWLIWTVVAISVLYSTVGLFALGFMPNGRVFGELAPSKFVISTFLNQNTYATFAGIGFLAAIGMTLRLYRRHLSRTGHLLRLQIAALIDTTGGKGALPLILAFVLFTGLLLSGSRGGIFATGLGLLVLFGLNMRRGRQSLRYEALPLIFATLVVGALVVGAVFLGLSDVLARRIAADGVYESQGRMDILLVTIRSILNAPLLGFGYGAFSATFPMFHDKSVAVWIFWDMASNTYLEELQGLGLPFGTMLIASVVVLVWDCLKGARTRQRDATIPAIAASVSFLVGAHALVDISLQIQAVTLTYMAILGVGAAQAYDEFPSEQSSLPAIGGNR
jgi:hypothetical protein